MGECSSVKEGVKERVDDKERPEKDHPVNECVSDLHMVFAGLRPLLPAT
jgi:hypothetical protein